MGENNVKSLRIYCGSASDPLICVPPMLSRGAGTSAAVSIATVLAALEKVLARVLGVLLVMQACWAEENHHEGPANPLHQRRAAGLVLCRVSR
jgi:hypothetical protein